MYGYRKTNENGLMTNLNSISSSLSSIDTVGRRNNQRTKASVDNLITTRSHSIASTRLLWPKSNGSSKNNNDNTYATTSRLNHANSRHFGSEIYYSGKRRSCKISSENALNFILLPILLLTIMRQVFDFLGQVWLQILINFFTIILLIVALFGIRQRRISYLIIYSLWALFNTFWNIVVICIYSKIRDLGLTEDFLSLYTGATSWWHTNGFGCLPNISSIQPTISIIQPSIMTSCKIDYHGIETSQAALHALLSFSSALLCLCIISNLAKNPNIRQKSDKLYRLNTLTSDRSKVNQNPYPTHAGSRYIGTSASLRRAPNKNSSRSSQHSMSSQRSARRRSRHPSDSAVPTPRGSVSSTMQRNQKYGSLSSRRSNRKERKDASSLTYGATVSGSERAGPSARTRLSSVSSNDYLPSYQPPHSSNTNLLSSYGEISSIDSYNNRQSSSRSRPNPRYAMKGNTNPTYAGSRGSIYSSANPNSNNTNNNYDDLSYIYGNNSARNSEIYGASTSKSVDSGRAHKQNHQPYQKTKTNSIRNRNGFTSEHHPSPVQEIRAETHQVDNSRALDSMTNAKLLMASTNGTFQSFSRSNNHFSENVAPQINGEDQNQQEINNNYMNTDYQETVYRDKHQKPLQNGHTPSTFDSRPRGDAYVAAENPSSTTNQSQIYSNNRYSRYPIYSNHQMTSDGNSETPI